MHHGCSPGRNPRQLCMAVLSAFCKAALISNFFRAQPRTAVSSGAGPQQSKAPSLFFRVVRHLRPLPWPLKVSKKRTAGKTEKWKTGLVAYEQNSRSFSYPKECSQFMPGSAMLCQALAGAFLFSLLLPSAPQEPAGAPPSIFLRPKTLCMSAAVL